eukprot:gene16-853_t
MVAFREYSSDECDSLLPMRKTGLVRSHSWDYGEEVKAHREYTISRENSDMNNTITCCSALKKSAALKILMFVSFQEVLIFSFQIWVTIHANSLAVFTDMVYGGFDLVAACLSFVFEFLKVSGTDVNRARIWDDTGSSISLLVLLVSTLTLLGQSLLSLTMPSLHKMDVHEDPFDLPDIPYSVPNANLVLYMVSASVANDLIVLTAAFCFGIFRNKETGINLNVCAGMMHVFADLLRCLCVLADGVIIKVLDAHANMSGQAPDQELEVKVDIWCTIVLCSIIVLINIPLIREMGKRLRRYEPMRRLFGQCCAITCQ